MDHIETIENAIIEAVKADVPVEDIEEAIKDLMEALSSINNQLGVIHSFE